MKIDLGTKRIYQGRDFFSVILPKVWMVNNNLEGGSAVHLEWDIETNTLIIIPIKSESDEKTI